MEVDDQRTPDGELGPTLAAGRDGVIHESSPGRVLRRVADDRDVRHEAEVMEHVRAAGYPVPEVFRVGRGEIEMERVDGGTMVDDLLRRPWRARSHGATLAELHRRLHQVELPRALDLPAPFGAADAEREVLLHLDLHPENVLLGRNGPVVVDWTNAARGPAGADDADTWLLLAGAVPDLPRWARLAVTPIRTLLCRSYVRGIDAEAARRWLPAAVERRARDHNMRAVELESMRRFVTGH